MTRQVTAPLSDEARRQCANCGAPVWSYNSLIGEEVLIDNAPGGVVIDGRSHAFRTPRSDGYRLHSDFCPGNPRGLLTADPTSGEFLWV